jgi:hypothetical protein
MILPSDDIEFSLAQFYLLHCESVSDSLTNCCCGGSENSRSQVLENEGVAQFCQKDRVTHLLGRSEPALRMTDMTSTTLQPHGGGVGSLQAEPEA